MKKLLALLLAIIMVFSLVACGAKEEAPAAKEEAPAAKEEAPAAKEEAPKEEAPAEEAPAEEDPIDLVAVIPFTANKFWDEDVRGGLERAAEELGVNFTYYSTENLDNAKWIEAMETAIANGCDGIITFVLNGDALVPIKEALGDKPLISIVSTADCVDVSCGTDDYNAGIALGQALAEAAGGEGTVGVMTGQLDDASLALRLEGLEKAMADAGMEIVAIDEDRSDISTGVQKLEAMLLANPEINCLAGLAANNAPEFAQVLSEQGRVDEFTCVGFDNLDQTLDAVRNGTIYATLVQRQYYAGYMALTHAVKILNGESVEKVFDTGTAVLTAENVDTFDPTDF